MACSSEVSAVGVAVAVRRTREYGLSRPSLVDVATALEKQTFKIDVKVARAGERVPQRFEIKP